MNNRPGLSVYIAHNLTGAERAFHLYEPHMPIVNYSASKRIRTTFKEMKTHTHTRVVLSQMGQCHVVVITQEALLMFMHLSKVLKTGYLN